MSYLRRQDTAMLPIAVNDLKTFVPARDAELSKKFYTDLGFTINWSNPEIAELQIGSFRFLLQTFYIAQHGGNFMMRLNVEDADAQTRADIGLCPGELPERRH